MTWFRVSDKPWRRSQEARMRLRRRHDRSSPQRLEEMVRVSFPPTGDKRLDKVVKWLLQRSQRVRGKGRPVYYFEGDVPESLVKTVIRALDPAKTARAKDDGTKEVIYYWGGMEQGGSFAFHRGAYPDTRTSVRFAANDFRQSAEWKRMYGDR